MLGCAILWFIINNNIYFKLLPFSDIHISKGSVVTCVRWGGIIKYEFDATLPLFWKSVNIWGSYGQEFRVMFFWLTAYMSLKWYVFLLSYVVFKRTEILASFQSGQCIFVKQMSLLLDNGVAVNRSRFRGGRRCWFLFMVFFIQHQFSERLHKRRHRTPMTFTQQQTPLEKLTLIQNRGLQIISYALHSTTVLLPLDSAVACCTLCWTRLQLMTSQWKPTTMSINQYSQDLATDTR